MRFFREIPPPVHPDGGVLGSFAHWSIRRKLLATLLPSVVILLFITGWVSNWASIKYLNIALGRNVIIQALAQSNALERLLEQARVDILSAARAPITTSDLLEVLEIRAPLNEDVYVELAFIGPTPEESLAFLRQDGKVHVITPRDAAQMRLGPLVIQPRYRDLKPGQVAISDVMEVFYPPLPSDEGPSQNAVEVVRLVTPCHGPDGAHRGYCLLSVNAQALRNILSLYNSPRSPLHGYPRAPENRYSFFFDDKGWILFQSENYEEAAKPLATDTARSGLSGDHGKTFLAAAFRPNPRHEVYWKMVVDSRQGKSGLESVNPLYDQTLSLSDFNFLGFAPVRFRFDPDREPEIIGGVAFVDRSRLNSAAELRQFDITTVISVVAIVVMSLIVFFLSRHITAPVRNLAKAVSRIAEGEESPYIGLPDADLESTALKNGINRMLRELKSRQEEIEAMDEHIQQVQAKQKVDLSEGARGDTLYGLINPIVGKSRAIENLKAMILKAASVEADVLLVGETGTGKELTAESIHLLSERSKEPFISINCGALDENLLMDTLFGHVKGAFSEAKTDRKGAFLAANGGTLFLDEIGNASPKVQQALLRALSVRRIRPLGSDQDVVYDVRVIAATNADLKDQIARGAFREDLYYRLKVITIVLSPLREHPEDIVPLAGYYLQEAAKTMKKGEIAMSKGALHKLQAHAWPGNVRELKHCLTRTAAMIDHELIAAEDLHFDEDPVWLTPAAPALGGRLRPEPAGGAQPGRAAKPQPGASPSDLSQRQKKALEIMQKNGSMTRQEYQQAVGGDLQDRTAQYDLRDLVRKGLAYKSGKGPATRYHPA